MKRKLIQNLLQLRIVQDVIHKEMVNLGLANLKNYSIEITKNFDVYVHSGDRCIYIGNLVDMIMKYEYLSKVKEIVMHVHEGRFERIDDRKIEQVIIKDEVVVEDKEQVIEHDSISVRDEYLGERVIKRALGDYGY